MQTVAVRLKTPSISSERMHSINSFKNDLRKKRKAKIHSKSCFFQNRTEQNKFVIMLPCHCSFKDTMQDKAVVTG